MACWLGVVSLNRLTLPGFKATPQPERPEEMAAAHKIEAIQRFFTAIPSPLYIVPRQKACGQALS